MSLGRPAQHFSAQERILQRVKDRLLAAGTDAGDFVFRGRVDPHSIEEIPAINIRRSTGLLEAYAEGVNRGVFEFELDHIVKGDEWETAADVLHGQSHAAIASDPELAQMSHGLRCIRTEPRAQAGDEIRGTLICTYQIQALQSSADITLHP